jgi:hypothetical protein
MLKDFNVYRGDTKTLTFQVSGDVTASALSFVVKADKVITSSRLIQKLNTVAGGSNSEILASYDSEALVTTISVYIEKIDTQDLTKKFYYYDLLVGTSSTSHYGTLYLEQDVQTDYDGTDLPADGKRYIPVILSNINNNDFIKRSGSDFVGVDLSTVISNSHSHTNKTLLDSYTQTEADLSSAVSLKHSHSNKSVLDAVEVALTTALKSNYDTAYTNNHTHSNKSNLDTIDQNLGSGNDVQFKNLTLTGTLAVQGTTVTVNATTVTVADNLIVLNKDEAGAGVTNAIAGIEIERGTATNYQFIFDEASDLFKVGMVGSLQAVATREDTPISTSIAFWNGATYKFETSSALKWNGTQLTDGTNAVSIANLKTAFDHASLTSNPHSVTASQVGLGNVTNESKATMFTSPTFTGNAVANNLAIGGATIGTNALAVTGTVAISSTLSASKLTASSSSSGAVEVVITNTNTAGYARLDMGVAQLYSIGSTYTPNGSLIPNGTYLYGSGAGGLNLVTNSQDIKFWTGGIADAGTAKLIINGTSGNATFTGVVLHPNGTAAAPAMAFSGFTNYGFYHSGGSAVRLSIAGTLRHTWTQDGYGVLNDAGYISLGAAADIILTRDAANTLALRNGTNAQTFKIYNTYTDATNYEGGFLKWKTNVLELGTEKGSGGGTLRALTIYNNGGYNYLVGSEAVDGSWRMSATASGSCVIEKRVSGSWVAAQTLSF